jgi:hypothetical protein
VIDAHFEISIDGKGPCCAECRAARQAVGKRRHLERQVALMRAKRQDPAFVERERAEHPRADAPAARDQGRQASPLTLTPD